MIEARINGGAAFKHAAQQMRAQGRRDLSKQMMAALVEAGKPIEQSISAEAYDSMPSGYKALLTASLAHRQGRRTGGQQARLILRTYADGQVKRRDIRALEKGILRHPLWGKRSQKWYITSFRPGFHARGTARMRDHVQPELLKVVQEFAQKLIE